MTTSAAGTVHGGGRSSWLRPALLVVLAAAAGLSAAGLAFQYSEASHGGTPAATRLALPADVLGVALALLFAVQLLAAYRLFAASAGAQFRMHRALAIAVLAFVALHGAAATVHALTPPQEQLPVVLVLVGLPAGLALGGQVYTGFGSKRHRGERRYHRIAVLFVASLVIAHIGLGTLHAITG